MVVRTGGWESPATVSSGRSGRAALAGCGPTRVGRWTLDLLEHVWSRGPDDNQKVKSKSLGRHDLELCIPRQSGFLMRDHKFQTHSVPKLVEMTSRTWALRHQIASMELEGHLTDLDEHRSCTWVPWDVTEDRFLIKNQWPTSFQQKRKKNQKGRIKTKTIIKQSRFQITTSRSKCTSVKKWPHGTLKIESILQHVMTWSINLWPSLPDGSSTAQFAAVKTSTWGLACTCFFTCVLAINPALVAEHIGSGGTHGGQPYTSTYSASCRAMSVLDSLRWHTFSQTHDKSASTEGKSGVPRFDGDSARLAEYSFRVRLEQAREKAMAAEELKKRGPWGIRLIDGLRGPALQVARNLAVDKLAGDDGPGYLLQTMQTMLQLRNRQEARELYPAGALQGGPLSPQHGGSIPHHVLRRKAWYRQTWTLSWSCPTALWPNSCSTTLDSATVTSSWSAPPLEEMSHGRRCARSWWRNTLVSVSGSPDIDKEDYMEAAARASFTTRDPTRATTRARHHGSRITQKITEKKHGRTHLSRWEPMRTTTTRPTMERVRSSTTTTMGTRPTRCSRRWSTRAWTRLTRRRSMPGRRRRRQGTMAFGLKDAAMKSEATWCWRRRKPAFRRWTHRPHAGDVGSMDIGAMMQRAPGMCAKVAARAKDWKGLHRLLPVQHPPRAASLAKARTRTSRERCTSRSTSTRTTRPPLLLPTWWSRRRTRAPTRCWTRWSRKLRPERKWSPCGLTIFHNDFKMNTQLWWLSSVRQRINGSVRQRGCATWTYTWPAMRIDKIQNGKTPIRRDGWRWYLAIHFLEIKTDRIWEDGQQRQRNIFEDPRTNFSTRFSEN